MHSLLIAAALDANSESCLRSNSLHVLSNCEVQFLVAKYVNFTSCKFAAVPSSFLVYPSPDGSLQGNLHVTLP